MCCDLLVPAVPQAASGIHLQQAEESHIQPRRHPEGSLGFRGYRRLPGHAEGAEQAGALQPTHGRLGVGERAVCHLPEKPQVRREGGQQEDHPGDPQWGRRGHGQRRKVRREGGRHRLLGQKHKPERRQVALFHLPQRQGRHPGRRRRAAQHRGSGEAEGGAPGGRLQQALHQPHLVGLHYHGRNLNPASPNAELGHPVVLVS